MNIFDCVSEESLEKGILERNGIVHTFYIYKLNLNPYFILDNSIKLVWILVTQCTVENENLLLIDELKPYILQHKCLSDLLITIGYENSIDDCHKGIKEYIEMISYSPREIFNSPYKELDYLIDPHLPEDFPTINHVDLSELDTPLSVREHSYLSIDSRRYISITSLWYEDNPFYLSLRGGREGKDETLGLLTDVNTSTQAYVWLNRFLYEKSISTRSTVNPEVANTSPIEFYGYPISSLLEASI